MQPSRPQRIVPPKSWEHSVLYRGIRDAIDALPHYFETRTMVEGLMATDIFTLNDTLGATIEQQVVDTLNRMRHVWDATDKYSAWSFVRRPQTFPDVVLRRTAQEHEVILGIELKGWYLLAKEGEPSLRFSVTQSACNDQDLLVVVPWALSNVLSGSPELYDPYVESAKYLAMYRNYWWQHIRNAESTTEIVEPGHASPYPKKSDKIDDKPKSDSGRNFGRLARTGIMDEYVKQAQSHLLAGIEARHWLAFFQAFRERTDSEGVMAEIARFRASLLGKQPPLSNLQIDSINTMLQGLEGLLAPGQSE